MRPILSEDRVHPAVRSKLGGRHTDLVDEIEGAIAEHDVVVVGMAQNPHPRKARRALDAAGIDHHDITIGSYLSHWRRRNALKMWTGWPTFPMVFVKGALVGGASDLIRLLDSGELAQLLQTEAG